MCWPVGERPKNQPQKGRVYHCGGLLSPFKYCVKRVFMQVDQAIIKINKAAKIYKANLENQNILFVFGAMKDGKPDLQTAESIATLFQAIHFMHLTGNANKRITAAQFYDRALTNRLGVKDYQFAPGNTSHKKLDVLEQFMQVDKIGRMIGNVNGNHLHLYTEKLVGTTNTGCMGLRLPDEASDFFVPNSLLKGDVRDFIDAPGKTVFAIYKKHKSESEYTQRTYLHKSLTECDAQDLWDRQN